MQRSSNSSSSIAVSAARAALAATLLTLAACGGNSDQPLELSGTVSGLKTSGLVLTSNGVNLDVSAGATSFTFGPVISDQVVYDVIVVNQPAGQTCSVANGTGTATTANITNVVITCSNRTFNIGGTISGLTAAGLVLANGSDTLDVPAGASSFTMPTGVAYGASYALTVAAQPAGLTCDVANGSGTIGTNAVTNIAVTCTDKPLTVGGGIRGLGSASGLVLGSGAETYAVPSGATGFTFAAPHSPGIAYEVRVQSQPTGLTCSTSNGRGTMPAHDVADVSITCSEEAFELGGTITGLTSLGLVLADGDESVVVPANAADFTMPTPVAAGSSYAVSVRRQPAGLTCTVGNGAGTVSDAPVTDVEVTCASSRYTLGGTISGLTSSGLVLTDGIEDLSVAANAARFSMPSALAYGSSYALSIRSQPSNATCQVAGGSGTVDADVDSVQISCAASAPQ